MFLPENLTLRTTFPGNLVVRKKNAFRMSIIIMFKELKEDQIEDYEK